MRTLPMSAAEIVGSYKNAKRQNEQIKVLAELNDCSVQDILNILTEQGAISGVTPPVNRTGEAVEPRPPKKPRLDWTVELEKDLIRFYEQGLKAAEISERMGIGLGAVSNKITRMKKAGYLFPAAPADGVSGYQPKGRGTKPAPPKTGSKIHPPAVDCMPHIDTPLSAGQQRHFETGAVRDSAEGKGSFDLLPWGAIHALAKHSQRGAEHYGRRNIDKGLSQSSLIDSAVRHICQYIQGDAEDYHLVAALWNIAWACEQEIKRPEMVDLPERGEHSGKAV